MGIYNLGGGGGAPVLEARTVTPSTSQQIIKPSRDEYDGLSQVTVEATPLETRTVNPSTSSQIITPSGSNIGFSTVTVNPYRLQSKSDTPASLPTTYSPSSGYDGLSSVTVLKPPDLVAENILTGSSIFNVMGHATIAMPIFLNGSRTSPNQITLRMYKEQYHATVFTLPSTFRYLYFCGVNINSESGSTIGSNTIIRFWYPGETNQFYPVDKLTSLSANLTGTSFFYETSGMYDATTSVTATIQDSYMTISRSADQFSYVSGNWYGCAILLGSDSSNFNG